MSGTINLALTQQFDSEGIPLSGGRLFFFAASSTTPQSAFQDQALTILHPNPLVLDASGRIPMFYLADGGIKVRLEDRDGLSVFAADNLLVIGPSSGGGGGGGGSVDPTTVHQTGDIKPRFGSGGHTGWVPCNGLTIGNATSSATQLADPSAEALFKYLWSTPMPLFTSGGSPIGKSSAAADWNNNNQIALPDLRGRGIAGLDDMGTSAANRLTSGFWGADGKVLGNVGGNEQKVLVQANVPPHTHSGSTNFDGAHTHGVNESPHAHGLSIGTVQGSGNSALNSSNATNFPTTGSQTTGISVNSTGSAHSHGFTTDSGNGSSSPLAIASPSMVMTFYIKL